MKLNEYLSATATDRLDMEAVLSMTLDEWRALDLSIGDAGRFRQEFPALARDREDAEQQLVKWLDSLTFIAEARVVSNIRRDRKRERKARAKTIKAWGKFLEALETDRLMKAELLQSDALEEVHDTLMKYEHVPESPPGREQAPHMMLSRWAADIWSLPTPAIIRAVRAVMPISDRDAASIRATLNGRKKSNAVDLNAAMRAWR